jgi:APA family basic amino acid/polyamine antiporter
VLVALVLGALALVVAGAFLGGEAGADRFGPILDDGPLGILRSAGLLFFAFAGYARIATLGEEVVDPARTIPRAVPIALGATVAVYALVAVAALAAVGPEVLAGADAPLAEAVRAGDLEALVPVVRVGGAIAALGVLLSLLAGVSRTTFAMAADGALPRPLAAVHPVSRVPHRAEAVVGAAVAVLVALTDLRHAIGFSSFCVLTYYAIANASAWTLPREHLRWPRAFAAAGLAGCATLALTLPVASVAGGAAVLALGALAWSVRRPARP